MLSAEAKTPEIIIRFTEPDDAKYLKEWLLEPSTLRWFPMCDEVEVDDSVSRWIAFSRYKCSLTAVKDGIPCGLATLYLQPYRRLAHQCEFGIIVGQAYRAKGWNIGEKLLTHVMELAKETFHIELLHLQVYGENPAIRLYRRFGFTEFGRQTRWLKDQEAYVSRVFMERLL
jgi:RimJ/RimL family protein N-acetyltransferase